MSSLTPALETLRSRVRRKPERANYDRDAVFSVIDEALYCHVGLVRGAAPVVIPTIHARDGDVLYLHGSPAAGHLRDGRRGADVCVAFTIVDGLALTRSARNHSLSYRSAVIFGDAEPIRDAALKFKALRAITDHVVPGRWDVVQRPSEAQLQETEVLQVVIREGSMKSRAGPPQVDETDGANDAWAGVIPLVTTRGTPVPAPFVDPDAVAPVW